MSRMGLYIAMLLSVVSLSAVSRAQALDGTIYVGMLDGIGSAVQMTKWNNGACDAPQFINGSTVDGLYQNVWVGAKAYNPMSVIVVAENTQVCDRWITPLRTNGFLVHIQGGPHVEWMFNFGTSGILMFGGGNDDVLMNAFGSAFTYADGQEDYDSITGSAGTTAYGRGGNDSFCALGQFFSVDGGSGYDTLCGSAVHKTSIENQNCTCGVF